MNQKQLILRMINYYSELERLKKEGEERIRSKTLAETAGVTPALVRKDFSTFNITGNRRGGYPISETIERLTDLLSKNCVHETILAGAGNIGLALLRYKGLEREKIKIKAAFETDASKITRSNDIPILPAEEMSEYIKQHKIKTAIIAVPAQNAQTVFEDMVNAGITGVTNFAPVHLHDHNSCLVNNVNLAQEMASLIYFAGKE